MASISRHKILRSSIAKCLFILLTALFVSNTVFPELQKYIGIELAELQESGETESGDQNEQSKEEVDGDEFVYAKYLEQSVLNRSFDVKMANPSFSSQAGIDISTPPPERV